MSNISANILNSPLTDLLPNNSHALSAVPIITGVTCDSRKVKPGSFFFALKGTNTDGQQFIPKAIEQGAVAILSEHPYDKASEYPSIVFIHDRDPRIAYSLAAKRFYHTTPRYLATVTGTNGKTSVTHFCRQLWMNAGHRAASIGTIGIYENNTLFETKQGPSLTTLDPADFYRILYELTQNGITHAAFEASSHGLDQHRFCGEGIKAGAFTNLTRDHLDYHKTMEHYFQAKSLLFSEYLEPGSIAVLNKDSDVHDKLNAICQKRNHCIVTYGQSNADITLISATPNHQGFALSLSVFGKPYHLNLPLVGGFQVENILCSLGIVIGLGDNAESAVESCSQLTSVPGRMQQVPTSIPIGVYVDYAHTPDALEKALQALKPHTTGSISVVFGCGGDRDPGKRPLMGAIAQKHAQQVIITDDNPRTEDSKTIRKQIVAAAPNAHNIPNREEAIAFALSQMKSGDTLLIAGKGHENYQIIGTTSHPFDDVAIAKKQLKNQENHA